MGLGGSLRFGQVQSMSLDGFEGELCCTTVLEFRGPCWQTERTFCFA